MSLVFSIDFAWSFYYEAVFYNTILKSGGGIARWITEFCLILCWTAKVLAFNKMASYVLLILDWFGYHWYVFLEL